MKSSRSNLAVRSIVALLAAIVPWATHAEDDAAAQRGLLVVGQDTNGFLVFDGSMSDLTEWDDIGLGVVDGGNAPSLLVIGAVASFDQENQIISIAGQKIGVVASTQVLDGNSGALQSADDNALASAAIAHQRVAIAGDVVGLGEGIARFVIPITSTLEADQPLIYVRGLIGHVDSQGNYASIGSLPLLLMPATPDIKTGDVVEALGYSDENGNLVVTDAANLSDTLTNSGSGLRGISGSGLRGISGSGLRGISGSGLRGISGSGLRGISGSGLRGISGSGLRGISGSGLRGISGSGLRGISGSGLRGISGSGLRGISGSGLRGISGSGLRGISGSGLRGISGSGLRGISGSGLRGISGSGLRGISGSGLRGISGSGLRGISGSGLRGISGSGLRGISGSGLRGISGSGLRGISGSGLRGISGSGVKR